VVVHQDTSATKFGFRTAEEQQISRIKRIWCQMVGYGVFEGAVEDRNIFKSEGQAVAVAVPSTKELCIYFYPITSGQPIVRIQYLEDGKVAISEFSDPDYTPSTVEAFMHGILEFLKQRNLTKEQQ
jgi:hypothetical protein